MTRLSMLLAVALLTSAALQGANGQGDGKAPPTQCWDQATKQVRQLWQACGAQISIMPADQHDQVLAATSHLPHLLAFTMMNHLNHITNHPENMLRFAGSGLRDFTRIASSSPEAFATFLRNEIEQFTRLAREAGID